MYISIYAYIGYFHKYIGYIYIYMVYIHRVYMYIYLEVSEAWAEYYLSRGYSDDGGIWRGKKGLAEKCLGFRI